MNDTTQNAALTEHIHQGLLGTADNWRKEGIEIKVIADGLLSAALSLVVSEIGQEQAAEWLRHLADGVESGQIVKTQSIN